MLAHIQDIQDIVTPHGMEIPPRVELPLKVIYKLRPKETVKDRQAGLGGVKFSRQHI